MPAPPNSPHRTLRLRQRHRSANSLRPATPSVSSVKIGTLLALVQPTVGELRLVSLAPTLPTKPPPTRHTLVLLRLEPLLAAAVRRALSEAATSRLRVPKPSTKKMSLVVVVLECGLHLPCPQVTKHWSQLASDGSTRGSVLFVYYRYASPTLALYTT